MVCPLCRGDRRVRASAWQTARPHVDVVRCPLCCEGNNVNASIEMMAVRYYLASGDIPQSVPALHQGMARLARQRTDEADQPPRRAQPTTDDTPADDDDALALQAEGAELERRLWVARAELAMRLGRARRRIDTIRQVRAADVVDADAWATDEGVWDRGEDHDALRAGQTRKQPPQGASVDPRNEDWSGWDG